MKSQIEDNIIADTLVDEESNGSEKMFSEPESEWCINNSMKVDDQRDILLKHLKPECEQTVDNQLN